MKKTTLKEIPKEVRKEVEDRDNLTMNPLQTSCVICRIRGCDGVNALWRKEGKYHIAHYKTRNESQDKGMVKENLVVMCNMHHLLQHQDLLEGRRIYEAMGKYLKDLYPDYYKDK